MNGLNEFIKEVIRLNPSIGHIEPFGNEFPHELISTLEKEEIKGLYSHQKQALNLAMSGKNIIVATPAASGKSLCYILPVLITFLKNPAKTALIIYPTKALARDQEKTIKKIFSSAGITREVVTYDGDTPKAIRSKLRKSSSVLITNPDMLHLSILPRHPAWAEIFSSTAFVVIDEIHQYRGVFGSNVANVLRRLDRVFTFYGSKPVWIAASATIGNPLETAKAITGKEFCLISEATSPSPGKVIYIASAPVVDKITGTRRSYLELSASCAIWLLKSGFQTAVFCNSRNNVEILLKLIREKLSENGMDPFMVMGYRAGYLPQMRREIENNFKEGKIACIISTSALELGIDIGSLDAVVMAGYPGTIAGFWQRIGRVGRRNKTGIAVLVASGSPIDQFIVRHTNFLTGSNPEKCYLNPDNIEILIPHLRCALCEIPFGKNERYGPLEGEEIACVMDFLRREGEAVFFEEVYRWQGGMHPAQNIMLRSTGGKKMLVVELNGETVEETDIERVLRWLHPKAVVQHAGKQYEVEKIDMDGGKVFVREVNYDFYTEPIVNEKLKIQDVFDSRNFKIGTVFYGQAQILQNVTGYRCIKYATNEIISTYDLNVPGKEMVVHSLWFEVDSDSIEKLSNSESENNLLRTVKSQILPFAHPLQILSDGLRGIGNVITNISSVRLMCDPTDLGAAVMPVFDGNGNSQSFSCNLFVFEQHQGGVGLVRELYKIFQEVLNDCFDVICNCECKAGCPSCVGPPEGSKDLKKSASIGLLSMIKAHESNNSQFSAKPDAKA